jgi:hypothetical protein
MTSSSISNVYDRNRFLNIFDINKAIFTVNFVIEKDLLTKDLTVDILNADNILSNEKTIFNSSISNSITSNNIVCDNVIVVNYNNDNNLFINNAINSTNMNLDNIIVDTININTVSSNNIVSNNITTQNIFLDNSYSDDFIINCEIIEFNNPVNISPKKLQIGTNNSTNYGFNIPDNQNPVNLIFIGFDININKFVIDNNTDVKFITFLDENDSMTVSNNLYLTNMSLMNNVFIDNFIANNIVSNSLSVNGDNVTYENIIANNINCYDVNVDNYTSTNIIIDNLTTFSINVENNLVSNVIKTTNITVNSIAVDFITANTIHTESITNNSVIDAGNISANTLITNYQLSDAVSSNNVSALFINCDNITVGNDFNCDSNLTVNNTIECNNLSTNSVISPELKNYKSTKEAWSNGVPLNTLYRTGSIVRICNNVYNPVINIIGNENLFVRNDTIVNDYIDPGIEILPYDNNINTLKIYISEIKDINNNEFIVNYKNVILLGEVLSDKINIQTIENINTNILLSAFTIDIVYIITYLIIDSYYNIYKINRNFTITV